MAVFYGQCKLCDCHYMGKGDFACPCGHPAANHIQLQKCTTDACDCDGFLSTHELEQCYNCLHSSIVHQREPRGDTEYNQLRVWVAQGIKHVEMVKLYEEKFGEKISCRTLQRRLANHQLTVADKKVTDDTILSLVKKENEGGYVGYRSLHRILRTKHNVLVSRDRLYHLMRSRPEIPKGLDPKLDMRKFHAKPFLSEGPNWLWAADGHEKLVQPMGTGLYIYGLIDTFSRKVLALTVIPDKKKSTVMEWLVAQINAINGLPKTLMIDQGTEWNDITPNLHVVQMKSTFNQKIEAFWSQMTRHSAVLQFRDAVKALETSGLFTRNDEKDRWAIWMAFRLPVQESLNAFKMSHNSHSIRKQPNVDLPTGYSPDVMWENPRLFEKENHMQPLHEKIPLLGDSFGEYQSRYGLTEDLQARCLHVTKETCVQLYTDIRAFLQQ